MACALTAGISRDCMDGVGGIDTIYVTELANKSTLTTTAGAISAFTLATGKQFWTYQQVRETASFSETANPNIQNQTLFYTQEVKVKFAKGETSKRNELRLLAQNRVMVIVKDNNGKYWLVGETIGAELTGGSYATGTAMGDFNGYDMTLTALEKEPAKEIDSALIADLLAPAA